MIGTEEALLEAGAVCSWGGDVCTHAVEHQGSAAQVVGSITVMWMAQSSRGKWTDDVCVPLRHGRLPGMRQGDG